MALSIICSRSHASARALRVASTARPTLTLPSDFKLLKFVSLAPAISHGLEELGLLPPGSLTAAILCSALASISGLLLFEPTRSSNLRAWLGQLCARFTPPHSPTHPES